MNKQRFRLVFSQRRGMLVPVAEDRTAQGKSPADGPATGAASPQAPPREARLWMADGRGMPLRRIVASLISAWQLGSMLVAPMRAYAAPSGGTVVSGSATISQNGGVTTIANSPNAIIDWTSFSAAQQEVVRFLQQNAASAVLNRVVGANPSVILGQLLSNGRVFLVNPNGVTFGAGSRVDTAGLVASSLGIANADFLAGRYRFDKAAGAGAAVQTGGLITVAPGGTVALIGDSVTNTGLIRADGGAVLLAAGRSVTLTDLSNPAIAVVVSAPENKVLNLGDIFAASGQAALIGSAIGQRGRINVDSAGTDAAGRIVLSATDRIEVAPEAVLSANGTGATDGGTILVGNQATGETTVQGSLSARGGESAGNGGFIETSGARLHLDGVGVDAGAPHGQGGTWLLDPVNIVIANGSASASNYSPTADSTITDGTISATLDKGTSVNITTSSGDSGHLGDITGSGYNITKTSGANATLTLSADHNIALSNGNIVASGAGNALNVQLIAPNYISVRNDATIATNGGNLYVGGAADNAATSIKMIGSSSTVRTVIDTRTDRSSVTSNAGTVTMKAAFAADVPSGDAALDLTNAAVYGNGIDIRGSTSGKISNNQGAAGLRITGTSVTNTGSDLLDIDGEIVFKGPGYSIYGLLFKNSELKQYGNGDILASGRITAAPGSEVPTVPYPSSINGSSIENFGQGNITLQSLTGVKNSDQTRPGLLILSANVTAHQGNVNLDSTATNTGSTMLNQVVLVNGALNASSNVNIHTRIQDASGNYISDGGAMSGTWYGSDNQGGKSTISAGGNLNIDASHLVAVAGTLDIQANNVNVFTKNTTSPTGLTIGGADLASGDSFSGPSSRGHALISDGFLQAAGHIAGNVIFSTGATATLNVGASGKEIAVGNFKVDGAGDIAVNRSLSGSRIELASGGNLTGNGSISSLGDVLLSAQGSAVLGGNLNGNGIVSVSASGDVELAMTGSISNSGNITLTAGNLIRANGNISKSAGENAVLTLNAGNNIELNESSGGGNISSLAGNGVLDIDLVAGNGIFVGGSTQGAALDIATNGGNVYIGGPRAAPAGQVSIVGAADGSHATRIDSREGGQDNAPAGSITIDAARTDAVTGSAATPVAAVRLDNAELIGDGISIQGSLTGSSAGMNIAGVHAGSGVKIINSGSKDIELRGALTYNGTAEYVYGLRVEGQSIEITQHGNGNILLSGAEVAGVSGNINPNAFPIIVSGARVDNLGSGNVDIAGASNSPAANVDLYPENVIRYSNITAASGNVNLVGSNTDGKYGHLVQIQLLDSNISASQDINADARYLDKNHDFLADGGLDLLGTSSLAAKGNLNVEASIILAKNGVRIDAGNVDIFTNATTTNALTIGGSAIAVTVPSAGINDAFLHAAGLTAGNVVIHSQVDTTVDTGSGGTALAVGNLQIIGTRNVAFNSSVSGERIEVSSGGNLTSNASGSISASGDILLAGHGDVMLAGNVTGNQRITVTSDGNIGTPNMSAAGNILVQAGGDIHLRGNIAKDSGSDASLLVNSGKSIDGNGLSVVSTSGKLDVDFIAGNDILIGSETQATPLTILTQGGNVFLGGAAGGSANEIALMGNVARQSSIDTRIDRSSNTSTAGTIVMNASARDPFAKYIGAPLFLKYANLAGNGISLTGNADHGGTTVAMAGLMVEGVSIANTGSGNISMTGSFNYPGAESTGASYDGVFFGGKPNNISQHGDGDINVTGTLTSTAGNGYIAPSSSAIYFYGGHTNITNEGVGDVSLNGAILGGPSSGARPAVALLDVDIAAVHGNVDIVGTGVGISGTALNQVSTSNTSVSASSAINIDTRILDMSGDFIAAGGLVLSGTTLSAPSLNVTASNVLAPSNTSVAIHAANTYLNANSTTAASGLTIGGNNAAVTGSDGSPVGGTAMGSAVISDGFLQAAGNGGNVFIRSEVATTLDVGASGNVTTVGNFSLAGTKDVTVKRALDGASISIASDGNLGGGGAIASAGDLLLSARGNVLLGGELAGNGVVRVAGNGSMASGNVANAGHGDTGILNAGAGDTAVGDVAGRGNVTVASHGNVSTGKVSGNGTVTVAGQGTVVSTGVVNDGNGDILAGDVVGDGDVRVAGLGNVQVGRLSGTGVVSLAGNGTVIGGDLSNGGRGDTEVVNTGTGITSAGNLHGLGDVRATGQGDLIVGNLAGNGAVTVAGKGNVVTGDLANAGSGDTTVANGGGGGTTVANVSAFGNVALTSQGNLLAGEVAGNGAVALLGHGVFTVGNVSNAGGGDTELVNTGTGYTTSGSVTGQGRVGITGRGDVSADDVGGNGVVAVAGNGNVFTGDVHNAGTGNTNVDNSGGGDTIAGGISAQGNVGVTGHGNVVVGDVHGNGAVVVAGNGSVFAGDLSNDGPGDTTVTNSGSGDTAVGDLAALGNVAVTAQGKLLVGNVTGNGVVALLGNGEFTAGNVSNQGHGNTGLVNAGAGDTVAGNVAGQGNVEVTGGGNVATGSLAGNGVVAVGGNGTVIAGDLANTGTGNTNVVNLGAGDTVAGNVAGQGNVEVTGRGNVATGNLVGNGVVAVGGNGTVIAGDLANAGLGNTAVVNLGTGNTATGNVAAQGNVEVTGGGNVATGSLAGNGVMAVGGNGTVIAGDLANAGKGNTNVVNLGAGDTVAGNVAGQGNVEVTGKGNVATGNLVGVGDVVVTAPGNLSVGGGNGTVVNHGNGHTSLTGTPVHSGNVSGGTVSVVSHGADTGTGPDTGNPGPGGGSVVVTPPGASPRTVRGLLSLTPAQISALTPAQLQGIADSGAVQGALQTLRGTGAAALAAGGSAGPASLPSGLSVRNDSPLADPVRAAPGGLAQDPAGASFGGTLPSDEVRLHCGPDARDCVD